CAQDSSHHLEQRALARAVLADYAKRFSGVNVERDIAQRPKVAMKGDAVQTREFFEARAGRWVDGITLGDVSELNDGLRHLLESTIFSGRPPTPALCPSAI